MAKTSKIFFARLFLILAFPFWFPRMVFWLVYEFLHCHIRDWFPAAFDKHSGQSEVMSANLDRSGPQLSLVQGGRANESHEESLLHERRTVNSAGLKLLRFHGSNPSPASFETKSARLKK